MPREFKIQREIELPASPEQVWDAVATGPGNAGWLWPMEIEGREGGSAEGGTVTAWEPGRHFAVRAEGEDGWFNALELIIEARAGGTALLRYMHHGVFVDDWDTQYDSADAHTDFYLHTLSEYLRHFAGRRASYVSLEAPDASRRPDALDAVRRALVGTGEVTEGERVRLAPPGLDPVEGVVDYARPNFIGVRTADGLYRFFGRNAWGMPVGVSLHLFADGVERDKTEQAWRAWLDDLYA